MIKRRKQSEYQYPADLVWAAACAAFRINGGYLKYPEIVEGRIVKPTNRELVKLYLADSTHQFITDTDRVHAINVRQVLAQALTMAMLKGEASEWGMLTARMSELETVNSDYELSLITAMPKSYEQTILREKLLSRLAQCDTTPVGRVGDKVNTPVEVVRAGYSNRYNTWYITGITPDNRQVFFAYREQIPVGQKVEICGRVKRHADRATQLSRVKLVEQEAV